MKCPHWIPLRFLPRALLPAGLAASLLAGFPSCAREPYDGSGPRVFLVPPAVFQDARKGVAAADTAWTALAVEIRARAEDALAVPPHSVMQKTALPPGNNPHDFVSPAPLWWPDPDQPHGLPYVWNREGNINPEYTSVGDQRAFEATAEAVRILALAHYLTGEERYAAHARVLLHTWFLAPATRMNPHLNHAWFERGRNTGTPFGVLSFEKFPSVLDAVGMLQGSEAWSDGDQDALAGWTSAYLRWLTDSTMGIDARKLWNRFGTAYDVQVASCALFLGREDLARATIEAAKEERINRHVRRDGRQPYELEREITFSNSVASVGYMFQLAMLGERTGVDLWHYTGPGGGSLRRALEFVAPYADPGNTWPYILEVRRELLRPALQQACLVYDDAEFRRLLDMLPADSGRSPTSYSLLVPWYDHRLDTLGTHLFVLDEPILARARREAAGDPGSYGFAMRLLRETAEGALKVRPVSVMQKTMTPPSGNKHDFMSIGGYYWPDPTKPGGLPWIYRDGKVNPQNATAGDWDRFAQMTRSVPPLALAYAMTGEERYAAHAAQLLRTWFLDPATRMNPHLKYAHAQPGVFDGSYYGIIHLNGMPLVIDAIGLLEPSESWTERDRQEMVAWVTVFLDWMLLDENAQEAGRVWNNHGTNYDQVAASFALFSGRRGLARKILTRSAHERIDRQIRPDGRLPFELDRNRAWGYTAGTLEMFTNLATMGSRVGVDLWNYRSPDGGGIRQAVDYMARYAEPGANWPYADLDFQKYGKKTLARLTPVLQKAALAYSFPGYGQLAEQLPADEQRLRDRDLPFLFYPYAPKRLP